MTSTDPDGGDGPRQAPSTGAKVGAGLTQTKADGVLSSSLIGRERELREIQEMLTGSRLLTLTGPGGTGKTTLAVALAEHVAERWGWAVGFVDLSSVRDPSVVPAAIAAALGLRATAEQTPLAMVIGHIGRGQRVLVLDNMEQLPAAASTIRELVESCPGLRVVVTSRIPLHLSGERLYPVRPLAVPATGVVRDQLIAVGSVSLFVERARRVVPDFDLMGSNADAVGAICRRLDGLPLAIELAAARIRLLSPVALLARLEHPLALLTGGPVDAAERHRTLRQTIGWSYGLLPAVEANVFARLGVFAGGFSMAAAMAVASEGVVSSEDELLDVHALLVDHSLLRPEPNGNGEPRFAMLETIREFGADQLEDAETIRGRHLGYFVRLAEDADAGMEGTDPAAHSRRLADDSQNFRAALAWAERIHASSEMLRLAAALSGFWRVDGDLREGRRWLERALGLPGEDDPIRAKAMRRDARLAFVLGDRSSAGVRYRDALRISEATGDAAGAAECLDGLGVLAAEAGDLDTAAALLGRGLATARLAGDTYWIGHALQQLGGLMTLRQEPDRARALLEEAIAVSRSRGHRKQEAVALVNLADDDLGRGEVEAAVGRLSAGIEILSEIDERAYRAWATLLLGMAYMRLGDFERARPVIEDGVGVTLAERRERATAATEDMVFALQVMADWLGSSGHTEPAIRAWASAEGARDQHHLLFQPRDRLWIEAASARDLARAGRSVASRAWREGRGLGLDDAVEAALASLGNAVVLRGRQVGGDAPYLTPRELEVLALVAEGRTDGQIADALFISKKTASVHVANLKGKLDTGSRVETATLAVRLGLVDRSG